MLAADQPTVIQYKLDFQNMELNKKIYNRFDVIFLLLHSSFNYLYIVLFFYLSIYLFILASTLNGVCSISFLQIISYKVTSLLLTTRQHFIAMA